MEHVTVPVGSDLALDAWVEGDEDGRPVLLLHGFPQSAWCWREVSPLLAAAGCRVVAVDQRGAAPGARPTDVEAFRIGRLVEDVLAVMDHLGLAAADVVGHDWGAAVAWQLAAHHPHRVSTLAALSVPHPGAFSEALATDPDQRERSSYIRLFQLEGKAEEVLLADDAARLRRLYAGVPGVDVDRYVALMREPGALTACLSWYRAQRKEDYADVPAVAVPTLFVWPDADVAIGRTAAELCGGHVSGPYAFEVLPGVSHWAPEEAPERVAELVLAHLTAHPRAAASTNG